MNKKNKEVYDAVKAKFSTNKTGDEVFTDKTYWGTVPVDQEGTAHEIPRSNPDVLSEDVSPWLTELTEEQERRLQAVAKAKLTRQERQCLELYSTGLTMEKVGAKIGLTKYGVYSALKRAKQKVLKKLGTQ